MTHWASQCLVEPQWLILVDDDEGFCEAVGDVLDGEDFRCIWTNDPRDLTRIKVPDPSVVLLDLVMAEVDGGRVMERLAASRILARISIVSGTDPHIFKLAYRAGRRLGLDMAGILSKPLTTSHLLSTVNGWVQPSTIHEPVEIRSGLFMGFWALLAEG